MYKWLFFVFLFSNSLQSEEWIGPSWVLDGTGWSHHQKGELSTIGLTNKLVEYPANFKILKPTFIIEDNTFIFYEYYELGTIIQDCEYYSPDNNPIASTLKIDNKNIEIESFCYSGNKETLPFWLHYFPTSNDNQFLTDQLNTSPVEVNFKNMHFKITNKGFKEKLKTSEVISLDTQTTANDIQDNNSFKHQTGETSSFTTENNWRKLKTNGMGVTASNTSSRPSVFIQFELKFNEYGLSYGIREVFDPERPIPDICSKKEDTINIGGKEVSAQVLCVKATSKGGNVPQIVYIPFETQDENHIWEVLTTPLDFSFKSQFGSYNVSTASFKPVYTALEQEAMNKGYINNIGMFWRSMGDDLFVYKGLDDLGKEARLFIVNNKGDVVFGWYERYNNEAESNKYCVNGVNEINLNSKKYEAQSFCTKDEGGYFANHFMIIPNKNTAISMDILNQKNIELSFKGKLRSAYFDVYNIKEISNIVFQRAEIFHEQKKEKSNNDKYERLFLVCEIVFGDQSKKNSYAIDFDESKVNNFNAIIDDRSISWFNDKNQFIIDRYAGTIRFFTDDYSYEGKCHRQTKRKF